MEIKLRRAVVQYFAPIFPADVRGGGRRGKGRGEGKSRRKVYGEEERGMEEREEIRGENGGKSASRCYETPKTIIIAP